MAESAPLEDEPSPNAVAAEDEAALLARHSREAKELRGIEFLDQNQNDCSCKKYMCRCLG